MDLESVTELIVMNWLGIFSLVATIFIAIVTINYRNKQHQIKGLLDAFKILNTREHRTSRRKVYELYIEYEKSGKRGHEHTQRAGSKQ